MPPRTSYELAEAGEALQRVIDAIDEWARTHLAATQRRVVEYAEIAAVPPVHAS